MPPIRVNQVLSPTWDGSSGSSYNAPAINITAGNTIVACIGGVNQSWTVTGVTDTAGNTYAKAIDSSNFGDYHEEIWIATGAIAHAANVVTFAFSVGTVNFRAAAIIQYTPLALDDSDRASGPSTGTQTTPAMTGTTVESVQLLMSRWGFLGMTYPAGFTVIGGSGSGAEVAEKIDTAGPFSGTFVITNGHHYIVAVILKTVSAAVAEKSYASIDDIVGIG